MGETEKDAETGKENSRCFYCFLKLKRSAPLFCQLQWSVLWCNETPGSGDCHKYCTVLSSRLWCGLTLCTGCWPLVLLVSNEWAPGFLKQSSSWVYTDAHTGQQLSATNSFLVRWWAKIKTLGCRELIINKHKQRKLGCFSEEPLVFVGADIAVCFVEGQWHLCVCSSWICLCVCVCTHIETHTHTGRVSPVLGSSSDLALLLVLQPLPCIPLSLPFSCCLSSSHPSFLPPSTHQCRSACPGLAGCQKKKEIKERELTGLSPQLSRYAFSFLAQFLMLCYHVMVIWQHYVPKIQYATQKMLNTWIVKSCD